MPFKNFGLRAVLPALILCAVQMSAAAPYKSAVLETDGCWRFTIDTTYWDSSNTDNWPFLTGVTDVFGNAVSSDSFRFPLTATNLVFRAADGGKALIKTYFTSTKGGETGSGDAVSASNALWHVTRGVQMLWTTSDAANYVPVKTKPDVKFLFDEGSELRLDHQLSAKETWGSACFYSARTNIMLRGATVFLWSGNADRRRLAGTLLVKASVVPSVISATNKVGFLDAAAAGGVPKIIVEDGAVLRIDAELFESAAASSFIKLGGGALVIARSSTCSGTIDVREGSLELEDGVALPAATVNVSSGARAGRALSSALEGRAGDFVHDTDETLSIYEPLKLTGALDVRSGKARLALRGAPPESVRLGDGVTLFDDSFLPEPGCVASADIHFDASRCGTLSNYETLPNFGIAGGSFVKGGGAAAKPGPDFGNGLATLCFSDNVYLLTGFTNDSTDLTVFLVTRNLDVKTESLTPQYRKFFCFVDADGWDANMPSGTLQTAGVENKCVYLESERWSDELNQYNLRGMWMMSSAERIFKYLDGALCPLYDWRAPVVERLEITHDEVNSATRYTQAQYGAEVDEKKTVTYAGGVSFHHTSFTLGGTQSNPRGGVTSSANFHCGEFIAFFRRLRIEETDSVVEWLRRKWLQAPATPSVTVEVPAGAEARATFNSMTNVVKTGPGVLVCREVGSLAHEKVVVSDGALAFDGEMPVDGWRISPGATLELISDGGLGCLGWGSRAGLVSIPDGGSPTVSLLRRLDDAGRVPFLTYGVYSAAGGGLKASKSGRLLALEHDVAEKTWYVKPVGMTLIIVR